MVTLTSGKTLGSGDLALYVRDGQGSPVVPASISYTIFSKDPASGVLTPMTQPKLAPASTELGLYYIPGAIPTAWGQGTFTVIWYLVQAVGQPESSVTEDFYVQPLRPDSTDVEAPSVLMATRLGVTAAVADLIMTVRELLSDTNPDRNYHFRPPTAAKSVANFSSRVGFIWTDETILRLLKLSIAQINTGNTKNLYSYTITNIPADWAQAAALGAAAKCLSAESARWIADEFGYSLNGVSLDLEKSSKYMSLGQQYSEELKEWIPILTANRPATLGLRQTRWLR